MTLCRCLRMCSDIEGVFLLMWMNRQTLHEAMPREIADEIVFHLLIPTKRNIGFAERMAIDDGIGKLIIKGHKNNGRSQVWFNFVRKPAEVILEDVGNLDTDGKEFSKTFEKSWRFGTTGMGFGFAGFASAIPCPPLAALCAVGYVGSLAMAAGGAASIMVSHLLKASPRLLGPPQGRLP